MITTWVRPLRRLLLALAAALFAVGLVAPAAHAEDGYRYWSYYQWDGSTWSYAQKGPDGVTPKDGGVEGWRFAISTASVAKMPRAAGDFATICAGAPAESGKKRVAVVVDQGVAADAVEGDTPDGKVTGTCVVADSAATGIEVLAAVADVRKEQGKTCAIGGYPSKGCIDTVKIDAAKSSPPPSEAPVALTIAAPVGSSQATTAASPAATAAPAGTAKQGMNPLPWIIGALLLAALGVGGYLMARRGKATGGQGTSGR